MRKFLPYALTFTVVAVAAGLALWRYQDYLTNPWTRDGQVMANVIQVAPRVSGPVVELPIIDNQRVKAGDLLFRIDPRTYETDLALARAKLDRTEKDLLALDKQVVAAEASVALTRTQIAQAESDIAAEASIVVEAERQLARNAALLETGDVAQAHYDQVLRDYRVDVADQRQAEAALLGAQSSLRQAEAQLAAAEADRGLPGPDNARLRETEAGPETAALNLGFTEVRASVDGMITNLEIRLGSQAVANQPILALIDENSYRIDAYFRETLIYDFKPGDAAVATLMGDTGRPIRGHVDSIGWGVSTSDGSAGPNLLPQVSPTFEWIRLAQRIPVRIALDDTPVGLTLRIGQTASVLVRTEGE